MSSRQANTSRAWDSLTPPLSPWLREALPSMGFERMTPVQASTIPLFMGHKDVVVEAVTGSGKTLAFLIPVIERLLRLEEPVKRHHVGAIIISPTRELATQIHSVLRSLLAFHPPSAAAAAAAANGEVEGEEEQQLEAAAETSRSPRDHGAQRKVVAQLLLGGATSTAQDLSHFLAHSPNLLISTPGRLLELISSPKVHCPQSSFEVLVLDEADRLLDLGFKDDLQKILARLPKQRRTGLFSASVSEAVGELVRAGLRNPVKIAVRVKSTKSGEDQRTPASLQMSYHITPPTHKFPALARLLAYLQPTPQKTIVYVATCAQVDYFQHLLPVALAQSSALGFTVIPLHGKHVPGVRQKNFTRFLNAVMPAILLTTDVAARGLDVPQVDLVVQFDPPVDPKVFIHRCGRAGRAGRKGLSVVFLQPEEQDYVGFMEVRKTPILPLTQPILRLDGDDGGDGGGGGVEGKRLVTATIQAMRKAVLADRALHDKAQRAFVSWVRAYSKHQTSSIFRVGKLDWAALGNAWALLRLPRMPELKRWTGDRSLGVEVDMVGYAYANAQREKARRLAEEEKEAEDEEEKGEQPDASGPAAATDGRARKRLKSAPGDGGWQKATPAWSRKAEDHAERLRRREKKQRRRTAERAGKKTAEELEQERQLHALLEQVKQRKSHDDVFEGFGD